MFVSCKISRKLIAVFLGIVTAVVLMTAIITTAKDHTEKDGIFVPIIMYHSILKDEDMCGDYVVSPVDLEKDMIYLRDNGYTPVFVNDLIRYVNNGESLPSKPVVLTFDDGTYNNYTYLLPLLEKYDFKATISIVGEYTVNATESGEKPNPAYSYLRWEDIGKMRETGRVEFCSHTYGMHNLSPRKGASRMNGESYNDYRSAFLRDIFRLQDLCDENCGFKPNVFTYPFGACDESAKRLVKNCGFSASLGVEEKPNYIKQGNTECLFNLHRYNRAGYVSTEDFMKKLLSQ